MNVLKKRNGGMGKVEDFFTRAERWFDDSLKRSLVEWQRDGSIKPHDIFGEGMLKNYSYPRINMLDDGTSLHIEATVPGLTKEHVDVEYKDGQLVITGVSQNTQEDEKKGEYFYREVHKRAFTRTLAINPSDYDVTQIDAKLEHGMLYISIPRTQPVDTEAKKIEIK